MSYLIFACDYARRPENNPCTVTDEVEGFLMCAMLCRHLFRIKIYSVEEKKDKYLNRDLRKEQYLNLTVENLQCNYVLYQPKFDA